MKASSNTSSVAGRSPTGAVRRRRLPLVAVLVVLLLAVAVFRPRPKEPEYAGKPLHVLLEQISENPRHAETAIQAVRAIGTNAIPWLLADLEGRTPRIRRVVWKDRANRLLNRQSLSSFRFSENLAHPEPLPIYGFFALGSNANAAIPALIATAAKKPVPAVELYALAFVGKESIPFLLSKLTNETSLYVPSFAALAVATAVTYGSISVSDAQPFVPVLTGLLQSTNVATRAKAKTALEYIQNAAAGKSPDPGK